jgi:hypothetical protein
MPGSRISRFTASERTVLGFGIRWNDQESVPLSEIFPLLAIDREQLPTIEADLDLVAQLSFWR